MNARADWNSPSEPGAEFDIGAIVGELHQARTRWRESQRRRQEIGGRELPSREALAGIVASLSAALFPMRLGPPDLRQESEDFFVGHTLDVALHALRTQVRLELGHQTRLNRALVDIDRPSLDIVRAFGASLGRLRVLLDTDVLAAFHGDPAARSVDEVLICYPGVRAMIHHRIAHELHRLGVPLLARIVSELSHAETGIDIHPGATIGAGFFIDHGTGAVIGETAEIGRNVRLYQAVTLGARRFATDAQGQLVKGGARHPVVEDDVVIYAGATLLGRITIGKGSTIGGNVWLTRSVPPGSHVAQAQAREGIEAEVGGRDGDGI